jgi:hypothetical protein
MKGACAVPPRGDTPVALAAGLHAAAEVAQGRFPGHIGDVYRGLPCSITLVTVGRTRISTGWRTPRLALS